MKKLFPIMSNVQTNYHFKLDFQKVDQYTRGKYGTKYRKDNQLSGLELPFVEYCGGESEHDRKNSEGNMTNLVFKWNVQG